jgi:uncharacterized protein YkwD
MSTDIPQDINGGEPNEDEAAMLQLINNYRAKNSKDAYLFSRKLSAICAPHSAGMLDKSIPFGHQDYQKRFELVTETKRLSENVAYNQQAEQPIDQMLNGWMNDASTTKNILGDYTHVGIAIAHDDVMWFSTVLFAKV